jgi:DNA-binding PadR family transcriptional regulator
MEKSGDWAVKLLPLREPTFYILLSLSAGSKHGYAIIKDVGGLSNGSVRLSTGTLYEALARLLDQSLIERVIISDSTKEPLLRGQNHPGRPRKTYQLTQRGRRLLRMETNRLQAMIAAANQRLGPELTG